MKGTKKKKAIVHFVCEHMCSHAYMHAVRDKYVNSVATKIEPSVKLLMHFLALCNEFRCKKALIWTLY